MNFEDYETLPTQNIAIHMTAGAIAGIMEHCVMYPLDSVKTRMQSLGVTTNNTVFGTLRHMVQQEGVFRPIRGISAVVMGAGPAHALYFSTYEFTKETLTKSTQPMYHHFVYGVSGCLASLVHDAISNPTEVVKQRLQMMNSPYRTVLECVTQVYKAEGFKAFYRSYVTQLSMNIPFQTIHVTSYELMQSLTNKERSYNPPAHMISGAVAGAFAAAATTPLDVCKTVLNTQEVKANGLFEAIHYIFRLSGPLGFFKGLQARVLYQMPAAAICWSTYESFKFLLLGRNSTNVVKVPEIMKTDSSKDKVLRLVLPQAAVKADNFNVDMSSGPSSPAEGVKGFKAMELPAVSGANLYGTLSLNTVHHGECQVPTLRHT